MRYKFTEFLNHTGQAFNDLINRYETDKGLSLSSNDSQLVKNAYYAGARDAASHIKLHGGFKFEG